MDSSFCIEALREALSMLFGAPDCFHADQGAPVTSEEFTGVLQENGSVDAW